MSNRPKRQVPSSAKVSAARQSASGGSTPVWVWGLVAAVVVVAGILAVVVTSGSGDDTVTTSSGEEVEALVFGEPSVEGEPLPEKTDGGTDPAVGMTIPTATSQTLAGEPATIAPDGSAKIVMFLAHWCPHCQAEVPRLVSWLDDNGRPENVELYAVATATNETQPNYPPGEWLAGEDWPVTTLVDDSQGTLAGAYGLSGFPFFVVVGADGEVLARTSGELDEAAWEQLVAVAESGSVSGGVSGGASSPR